ncbi:MAG: nitrite/sulfite reductase, partial [bacterium]
KEWLQDNVYGQKQRGYAVVTIKLPLGDITAQQLRKLADIARRFIEGTVRTTVEQNIVLRWVSETDLPALYRALQDIHLATPGAGTIEDITACPGTDTCKLGIASSRGLAAELRTRFANGFLKNVRTSGSGNKEIEEIIRRLHIKISGCFNSCGQHHIADLGFYGVNRKVGSHTVPHFQVVLGGQWSENAGSYGLAIGAVPSKRIPEVVERIATKYAHERRENESFQAFIKRIGKVEVKKSLEDLTQVPAYETDAGFYSDWGDPREFTLGDMGIGECAGEVVTRVEFELTAAEREIFEAQLTLEKGDPQEAGHKAYEAMLRAARSLVMTSFPEVPEDAHRVIEEFRTRFYDTELFFDPFARGKFAQYLFTAHQNADMVYNDETAHQRIEETQLFVEAVHACYTRMHHDAN